MTTGRDTPVQSAPASLSDSASRPGGLPDSDDARLADAVKSDDGFFTTYFVSSYSPFLVRRAARVGLLPDQVTCAALVVGLFAGVSFAFGSRAGLVVGAVLLQMSFLLDVVDGQLARYTGRMSAFGAWFDTMADRIKEYVAYAGLAIGSVRGFHEHVWALAGAALAVQVWRHMLDLTFVAGSADADPAEPDRRPARLGQGAIELSRTTNQSSRVRWAKRILVLPIGERMLLISLTAAIFRPKVTFLALLIWGSLAMAYGLAGRLLRSFATTTATAEPAEQTSALLRVRDDGPLGALLPPWVIGVPASALVLAAVVPWFVILALTGRQNSLLPTAVALAWLIVAGLASRMAASPGRLFWAVPPLLRLAEIVGVLRLAAVGSDRDLVAGYVLAGVLAYGCYDLLSGRFGPDDRPVTAMLTGGWPLRLILAFVLAAGGAVNPGFYVVAAALAVASVGDAGHTWKDSGRRQRQPAMASAEETP